MPLSEEQKQAIDENARDHVQDSLYYFVEAMRSWKNANASPPKKKTELRRYLLNFTMGADDVDPDDYQEAYAYVRERVLNELRTVIDETVKQCLS